ncbi:MAG: DnaJ C-terminal domain-containing protein [Ilumatobacteraceae bacterium]
MTVQREWFEKDYYAILGVPKDASSRDITKAYRGLARKFHPDANPGDTAAEERFKEISVAYDVLGDDAKRAEYDEARRMGPMGGFGPGAGGFNFDVGGADLNDILSQMFGGAARNAGFGNGPRRGQDMVTSITLSFNDAVFGTTTAVPGTDAKVRIPAGVADGQRIRLKGKGRPGANGGPSGDLFVECRVVPHALFGREGNNLLVRVPVSFAEAALGATVIVPTLEGADVTLRIKPGTQPGSRHRVRGQGIGAEGRRGDLIVTVDVVVPEKLSKDEERAVQELAKVLRVPREEKAGNQ